MGCSLAFYLSRAGRQVVVIDRGRIGQGATAACAGGIRAQFSTEINIRMGMEAKRLLAHFVEETGQTADFRPVGYLFLLTTDDERSRFRAAIELQRACGLDDVVELEPAEARAMVPGLETDDLSGATFCPSDGLAGPNEVTYGFANAARRQGAAIVEDTPIEAFLTSGGAVTGVRTAAGEIESSQTVICAGPWSAPVGAMLGLVLPIVPSRRQVFVSEPFTGIRRGSPMTIDFHTSFYFHSEGGGVRFGMTEPRTPPVGAAPGATWCNEARLASWRPPSRHCRRFERLYGARGFAAFLRARGCGRGRPHHFDEGLPGAAGGQPSPRSVCRHPRGRPQPGARAAA